MPQMLADREFGILVVPERGCKLLESCAGRPVAFHHRLSMHPMQAIGLISGSGGASCPASVPTTATLVLSTRYWIRSTWIAGGDNGGRRASLNCTLNEPMRAAIVTLRRSAAGD